MAVLRAVVFTEDILTPLWPQSRIIIVFLRPPPITLAEPLICGKNFLPSPASAPKPSHEKAPHQSQRSGSRSRRVHKSYVTMLEILKYADQVVKRAEKVQKEADLIHQAWMGKEESKKGRD